MKNIYFLFLLIIATTTLQAASLLDKEITISAKNQPLASVLDEIEKQTGVNFSYSSSAIDVSQAISIDVKNKPAEIVLQQLLGAKYEYKLKRKYIILKKSQVKIEPNQSAVSKLSHSSLENSNYITNQIQVKKLCYSDGGTALGDCHIITNDKNNEVMKKQLAMLMLATATTASAQTQDSTLTTKEQLINAGKSFTALVVEVANDTKQAVKIAADEIGKQTASLKVSSKSNTTNTDTLNAAAVEIATTETSATPIVVAQNSTPNETLTQNTLKVEAEQQPVASSSSSQAEQSKLAMDSSSTHPFLFTVFYPFSFPELQAEKYTYNTSLNLLVGYNGGVTGAELGWIANINRHTMSGFQAAGITNVSLGSVTGMQMAGIANLAAKDTAAVQLAGIVNVGQSALFQAAGITNAVYGNAKVQMAGIVNFSAQGNTSTQLAGIVNAANTANVQIAGITSVAKQADVQISGIANASLGKNTTQIAGIANVTDSSTFQLGLVNAASKVGTQIGLVNVCDTSSGIMLGLVNVALKGALREFEISSSLSSVNAAYRMGTRKFYTLLEVSYGYENNLWMQGLGVGTQIDFPKYWGMNIEALFQNVSVDFFKHESFNGLSQLRVVGYKQFAKHFKVFAGPALYVYNSKLTRDNPLDFKAPYTLYSDHSGSVSTDMWIGLSAGIRF